MERVKEMKFSKITITKLMMNDHFIWLHKVCYGESTGKRRILRNLTLTLCRDVDSKSQPQTQRQTSLLVSQVDNSIVLMYVYKLEKLI